MSGLSIQPRSAAGSHPPVSQRSAATAAVAPNPPSPRQDTVTLSRAAREASYGSAGEAMADGAARGAAVGGAIANGAIGAMMIRKGLQGATRLPATMTGKVLPYVGIGLSLWGMASSGVALKKTLSADTIEVRPAVAQGLNFVGNALIAGGSVAILTGVGTAPGLIASGAGFAMTAAATLIDP